jgi:hypothetical protein
MVRKVLAVRRGSTSEQVTTEPASPPPFQATNSSKQWKPACIKVTNSPLAGLVGAEVSGIVCPSFEVFLYATTAQRKQLSVMVTSGGTADLKLTFRQPLPEGLLIRSLSSQVKRHLPFGPIPIALGSSFEVTAGGSLSGPSLGLHAALHGSACSVRQFAGMVEWSRQHEVLFSRRYSWPGLETGRDDGPCAGLS